jgi:hypothetical protein
VEEEKKKKFVKQAKKEKANQMKVVKAGRERKACSD